MSTILIVEDEQNLANGLRYNMEAEGYQVEIAGDGETALESIKTHPDRFDVILLDVMLPGIDGFTVVSELRKAGLFVPVLIMTARGRPEDVLQGFAAGADDYLPKPFTPEQVRSAARCTNRLLIDIRDAKRLTRHS